MTKLRLNAKLILAALTLSTVVVFLIYLGSILLTSPHQRALVSMEHSMGFVWSAAFRYARKHREFPQDAVTLMGLPDVPTENPVTHEKDWLICKTVSSKAEAIAFARTAKRGQITYCPVKGGPEDGNFYTLGTDDQGKLLTGDTGKPVVLDWHRGPHE